MVTLNLSLTAEPAGFCDIITSLEANLGPVFNFSRFIENVSVRYVVNWFIII